MAKINNVASCVVDPVAAAGISWQDVSPRPVPDVLLSDKSDVPI